MEEEGKEEEWIDWPPKPRFSLKILGNNDRVEAILRHREEISRIGKLLKSRNGGGSSLNNEALYVTENPGGLDKLSKYFKKKSPVEINDLDESQFGPAYGERITLEIIEDAVCYTRIMTIAQDSTGNVVFVCLYCNNPNMSDDLLQEKFGIGCKITIANPFIKLALDWRTMIRVEEDKDVFIHKEKDKNMCRFCTKGNADLTCGRCKRAKYCSKECQTHDWKIMKHKKLCDLYIFFKNNVNEEDSIDLVVTKVSF